MPVLRAQLLGPPRFAVDEKPVKLSSAKPRALVSYLVATRQVHSRDRLASFFWPEVPERRAQASLRTALYEIRRSLGDHAGQFLFVERTRVAMPGEGPLELDIAALEATSLEHGEPDVATLQAAVEVYGGEFCEGLSLPDAYDFDDWVFLERERLAHLYLTALCRLGEYYAGRRRFAEAIEMARRVLAVDPLREDVHRALMRYYALAGQRSSALNQYKSCVAILERELGIEPLAATTELYERILANAPLEVEEGGPVPVVRAAARLASPPDPLAGLEAQALVGRAKELEALWSAWQRTVAGGSQIVLVAGEAGIGKTRLLAELRRRVGDEATVLFGRCHEGTLSQPYGPVVDALRRVLAEVDLAALELPEVWLRELARLLPELAGQAPGANAELDELRERDRLFEAVRSCLAALAARRPVLLAVDDAQWSDESSLSLLAYVTQRRPVAGLLAVVTFRSEEVDSQRRALLRMLAMAGESLHLRALTEGETAELVMVLGGGSAPPVQFGRRLHRATGGNPFFIVETLRALFDQGTLQASEAGWRTGPQPADDYGALPIPEGVGLIIDARLDRLSDDARTLLEGAAVLRRDFAFDLVQAVASLPATAALAALDELVQAGLVREVPEVDVGRGVRYDFSHALVRERVYGSLSGARRQYLHRQVAGLLEASVSAAPEKVAYHYLRGGVRDRACAWSLRAGAAALEVYAGEGALAHYRAARELAVTGAEEYAALAGMGDAHVSLGQGQEAIEAFTAALEHAPDEEARAELYRRIGRTHERLGEYDLALEAYQTARKLLGQGQPTLTALRVADGMATVYVRLGRHTKAAGLCLDALAWLAANPRMEGARRAEAWLRNTLGMAYLYEGMYDQALENLECSLALKRQLADRLGEATLLNNIGVVYYHAGDDVRAREHYAASLAIKEEIADGYGQAVALTNLALIETHLANYDAAARCLARAEAGAGMVGARWLLPEIRRVAAQRALAVGDTEEALAAAQAALEAAEQLGVPTFIGVAHRVLGIVKGAGLGDRAAAGAHFETSLAVFEMLDNEHELAKTHAAYGEVLTAAGLSEDAQRHLQTAAEVFSRLGAHGRLSRLEPLLGE